MPKKKVKKIVKKAKNNQEDSKLFAFLATFLSIIGFVIAIIAKRNDKYVMFYAKQSLVIFIISVIVGILKPIFMLIPITGIIINVFLAIFVLILWLLSWIYALSGEMKNVPFVGHYAKNFNFQ